MDTADQAQKMEEQHRENALKGARSKTSPQKKRGDVVVCIDCGTPVPEKRLAACPAASRCVGCQQQFEGEEEVPWTGGFC